MLRGGAERARPVTSDKLAEAFVAQWLESPVHRANLLSDDFTHVGCATRSVLMPGGSERFFSAQLFAEF